MTTLYRAPEYNDELYDQMTRDFMSDGLVVTLPHNTHIIIGDSSRLTLYIYMH